MAPIKNVLVTLLAATTALAASVSNFNVLHSSKGAVIQIRGNTAVPPKATRLHFRGNRALYPKAPVVQRRADKTDGLAYSNVLQMRWNRSPSHVLHLRWNRPPPQNYNVNSMFPAKVVSAAQNLGSNYHQLQVDTGRFRQNLAIYDGTKAMYASQRGELHNDIIAFKNDKAQYNTALKQLQSGNQFAAITVNKEKNDMQFQAMKIGADQRAVMDLRGAVVQSKANVGSAYMQVKADQGAVRAAYVNLKQVQNKAGWRRNRAIRARA